MLKLYTVAERAVTAWSLENAVFCRNLLKRSYVVTFLDFLYFIFCVGCSSAGVYNKMQSLGTLFKLHTCLMCNEERKQYMCTVMRKPWNKHYFMFDWLKFPLFFRGNQNNMAPNAFMNSWQLSPLLQSKDRSCIVELKCYIFNNNLISLVFAG